MFGYCKSQWPRDPGVSVANDRPHIVDSGRPASPERIAWSAGAVGAILCAAGWFIARQEFLRSYLWAYCFWAAIAVGSLPLLMLQHLTGGAWGVVIRRVLEANCRTIPLLAVLFLPLAFGAELLYPWAGPDGDTLPHGKRLYLSIEWWWARAAVYFAVWLGLASLLDRWSKGHDADPTPALERRMRMLSAPGLALYGVTITFASIDWVMSLEPHWISSIFGVLFGVCQLLTAFAFAVTVVATMKDRAPFSGVLTPGHFRDLGNLLLAFVMLWAYLAISQFILIWCANLQEEAPYYLKRSANGWAALAAAVFVFQFFVPFVALLSRGTKRDPRRLRTVAVIALAAQLGYLYWMIAPAIPIEGRQVFWTDAVTPIAIGGLWLGLFLRELNRRPLLPVHVSAALPENHHG